MRGRGAAFSVGGDIKSLVEDARVGMSSSASTGTRAIGGRVCPDSLLIQFGHPLYTLAYTTANLPLPYVAIIDGYVLGGVCYALFFSECSNSQIIRREVRNKKLGRLRT